MQLRTKIEIVMGVIAALVLGAVLFAWVNAREAKARAEATQAANDKTFQLIEQHDKARDAQLDSFVKSQQAALDALNKRFDQAKTAPDIAALVGQLMALQKPVTFVTPPATPENPHPAPVAQVPAEDAPQVKAYVQACEQCKLDLKTKTAQLTAAEQRRQDDAQKLQLLTDDRDKWKKASKGGGFFANLKRSAKWFGIGALGGAVALCGTGHCR